MTSRKTIVDQAIKFQNPPRIPVWFVNCDQTEGDVMVYHLSLLRADGSGDHEWGYHLEKLDDGTMGHPTKPHLPDWEAAERFTTPPLREEDRMAPLPAFLEKCGDRYRLASLDLSGFTVYTLLRGFENSMMDFLIEPERFAWLMDLIVDFECQQMALCARRGFHGIHFADDWGTQSGLMISPQLVAEAVQAPLPPAIRAGPRVGPARLVSLLREFRGDCRRLSRDWRGRAEHFAAERDGHSADRRAAPRQAVLLDAD